MHKCNTVFLSIQVTIAPISKPDCASTKDNLCNSQGKHKRSQKTMTTVVSTTMALMANDDDDDDDDDDDNDNGEEQHEEEKLEDGERNNIHENHNEDDENFLIKFQSFQCHLLLTLLMKF